MFVAAALMLDVATQASLGIYEKTIEKLSRTWPAAWHLIVVADDKCRAEHLERVRRRLTSCAALGDAVPADFSTTPWAACFRLAAQDDKFWDEQVRHPAAAWVAGGSRGAVLAPDEASAAAFLPGGLAAIAPPTEHVGGDRRHQRRAQKERRAAASAELAGHRAAKHPRQDAGEKKHPPSKGRGKGKAHTKDRSGVQICYAWNNSRPRCDGTAPHVPCANGRSHRCQLCLSAEHRSTECPQG